jgi:nucleolar protein 12
VTVPPKSRYNEPPPPRATKAQKEESEDEEDGDDEEDDPDAVDNDAELSALDTDEDALDDEEDDEDEEEDEDEDEAESSDNVAESSSEEEPVAAAKVLEAVVTNGDSTSKKERKRKRKNKDEDDDLESRYLQALADDDDEEPAEKRQKGDDDAVDADARSDMDVDTPPVHESIAQNASASELEKASRTVFLSNVCSTAITSASAKRTLLAHLSTILDKKSSPPQTIESIRFRSTAFATAGLPKRAAYIKKSVMPATTRSTNAYVVYSHQSCVRAAVAQLNGTVVLDRHLRVDSVAHPAPVAHRRCVFVGNLGFVDDETVLNTKVGADGKEVTTQKKRTKAPMDVEEGLWRVFGEKAGKVESVRVVRDAVTRVGKGFAYVQFYVCPPLFLLSPPFFYHTNRTPQDENAVESALLLAAKSFPPMLPRPLRVSRCKAPHKTLRAQEAKQSKFNFASKPGAKRAPPAPGAYVPKPTAEDQTLSGRASKLLGRSAAIAAAQEARVAEKKARRGDRAPREKKKAGTGSNGVAMGEKGRQQKLFRSPEDIVFEGRRASSKDGKPKDLKLKIRGKGKDPRKKKNAREGRGGVRAAKWRSEGKK